MAYDLEVLGEKLNDLALSVLSGDEKGLRKEFEKALFEFSYFFIIEKTAREDASGDFYLSNIRPKVDSILKRYKREKGEFISFFKSFLFKSFQFYIFNQKRGLVKGQIAEKISKQEIYKHNYNLERDTFNYSLSDIQEEYCTARELYTNKNVIDSNFPTYYKKSLLSSNTKKAFMCYTLRYLYLLEEKTIENIRNFIGLKRERMRELIQEAEESINKNIEEINLHRTLKDYYYTQSILSNRKVFELKENASLNSIEKSSESFLLELKKAESKNTKNKRLLNSHMRQIQMLSLVNCKDISRMLNIEYCRIRGLIYTAKKELIKMKKLQELEKSKK